jgi:monoamine oxidase
MKGSQQVEIIVVGAGIAGLSVARALAEAGKRVLILEARDRIGGRIYTVRDPESPWPLEMGAEFIHGRPPEFWKLLEEAGLTPFEREGERICQRQGALDACEEDGAWELLARMEAEPDRSFSAWLAGQDVPPATAEHAKAFVEGFNAADAGRIGTAALVRQQAAEDAIEGWRSFHLREGYDRVPEFLRDRCEAAGAVMQLETEVRSVRWRRGQVEVRAVIRNRDSDLSRREVIFNAQACVITLPLGVLQARDVAIDPMPAPAQQAIDELAMGAARRLVCVFDEPFWAERFPRMSFAFLEGDLSDPAFLRTWWTRHPDPAPVLTGWVGGPRAAVPIADREAFARKAIASLAAAFDLPVETLWRKLRSWHLHDWQSDAYSRGAYSYAPQGALHASEVLAQPCDETLYFAGEHTDTTGHWGTVHGALGSGLRVAEQLLRGQG